MSRIQEVLKQKRALERQRNEDKKERIESLKTEAIYKAKLISQLSVISDLFTNDSTLEVVTIEIPLDKLTIFNKLMYTELEEYVVKQVPLKANEFELRLRLV